MTNKEDRVQHPAPLLDFFRRIGAEVLNFRRAMVKEYKGAYYIEKTLIKILSDGTLEVSNKEHAPTKEEAEAIKAALAEVNFPQSIDATEAACKSYIAALKGDADKFYLLRSRKSAKIVMIQERVDCDDGTKFFRPHTLWSDGKWRTLEPEGALPFWKPREKRAGAARLMIHEGAKAARFMDWMLNDRSLEARAAREAHPWASELENYEHWGMIGGAMAPHRADYKEIKTEAPMEVCYVCDNDWAGRSVLKSFSNHYGGQLRGVMFDSRFKESFDLADPMPEALFKKTSHGLRWTGPTLDSLKVFATAATRMIPNPAGAGRPIAVLRDAFREEWFHVVSPEVFLHKDHPNRLFDANGFNSLIRPFSDVDDTARLVRGDQANKSRKMHYLPGAPSGFYGTNYAGQFLNTFKGTEIKKVAGDAAPWLDFMERLIPDAIDRHEVLRWCATLIARPQVKMLYGLLLISETQGVGKTTLGERILSPLVGADNTSFPSETDIVESQFNSWIAHKRLAIVNEIYAGASTKAYNKLKSIITDRYITVNKKHQSTYEIENWIHIYACSNSARALKLSIDDRRWCVPRITEFKQSLEYWTQLNGWLENGGGLGIILNWANEWLLDNRPVMPGETAPDSAAKRAMIEESMSPGMMIAAELLDHWKELHESDRKVICTDLQIVNYIKNRLYEGRHNDKLEKPATIRKLAKSRGWFVSEERTRKFSDNAEMARIISLDPDLAKRHPDALHKEDAQLLNIPE